MEFPPTNATLHSLPGGLTIILDEDTSAPVVSAQMWVETGSQHEGKFAGAGISHLLEHMVFKGTRNIPCADLATMVNAAGGQWNAYTSFDRTVYYIDGPSTSLPTFLEVLFELTFHPAFPLEDFETEKDVIRREIDMGNDDPDSASSQLLFSTFFQRDARRHPVIGHLDLFNAITHDDMVAYHRNRYVPSNAFFVLSGAFHSADVLKKIREYSAEFPTNPLVEPVNPLEPRQLGRRVSRQPFAVPTTKTTLVWQTPGLDHPDSPALELLSQIVCGGNSSPLYLTLHEESGLAHHIGSWAWTPADGPGMFSISAEVDPDKRDEFETAVVTEIDRCLNTDLSSALAKARRMITAAQFRTLSTASGRASDLASNWHEARSLDFTRNYIQLLETVTTDDLQRVAKLYLRDESLTITSLDPKDQEAPSIKTSKSSAPGEITAHTLSNGLQLIHRHDPRVPTVYMQSAFRCGLPAESPATSGINRLHSTLLTMGTTSRSSAEIAEEIESLGASLRAGSGNNTSIVSAFSLTPDLAQVLEVAADILINPTFPQAALERERETQLADLEEAMEDPVKTAFRTMRKQLFGNQHYGLHSLGSEESLNALTPELLRNHHDQYITGSNGALSLFGDISLEDAIALCEEKFAALPTGTAISGDDHQADGTGELITHLDKQQAVLAIGYPGAAADSADAPALELIHDYCSNMAGPLFTRIREELGLAYYVSATQFHGLGTGLFAFYLGTSPDQIELARVKLIEEITRLATEGVPDEAIEHSKTSLLASDALENQSNRAMAQGCAINTLLGLGPLHHLETAKRIRSLTPEDIREVTARYLGSAEPVIATVLPQA
ncbi:MAG: pitrilysin family protein [Akkermansiaceae bacterium]|nr:pitrilysin family protein [Akkermansiaceae bacterium]